MTIDRHAMMDAGGGGNGKTAQTAIEARQMAMHAIRSALREPILRYVHETQRDACADYQQQSSTASLPNTACQRFCSLLREVRAWSDAIVVDQFGRTTLASIANHLQSALVASAMVMHVVAVPQQQQRRRRHRPEIHVDVPSPRRFAHQCLIRVTRSLYDLVVATTATDGEGGDDQQQLRQLAALVHPTPLTALIDRCIDDELLQHVPSTGGAADDSSRVQRRAISSQRRVTLRPGGNHTAADKKHEKKERHRRERRASQVSGDDGDGAIHERQSEQAQQQHQPSSDDDDDTASMLSSRVQLTLISEAPAPATIQKPRRVAPAVEATRRPAPTLVIGDNDDDHRSRQQVRASAADDDAVSITPFDSVTYIGESMAAQRRA